MDEEYLDVKTWAWLAILTFDGDRHSGYVFAIPIAEGPTLSRSLHRILLPRLDHRSLQAAQRDLVGRPEVRTQEPRSERRLSGSWLDPVTGRGALQGPDSVIEACQRLDVVSQPSPRNNNPAHRDLVNGVFQGRHLGMMGSSDLMEQLFVRAPGVDMQPLRAIYISLCTRTTVQVSVYNIRESPSNRLYTGAKAPPNRQFYPSCPTTPT